MSDEKRQDEDEVPSPAGMPEMNPPKGGPDADPDAPDPEDLFPGRPGTPPGDSGLEAEGPSS